jgi:Salmonella virulence plasmid 65kDa B protein
MISANLEAQLAGSILKQLIFRTHDVFEDIRQSVSWPGVRLAQQDDAPQCLARGHTAMAVLTVLCCSAANASPAVTPTQFAVTEGGAATITVPIKVPRGIGGMEPQLSLSYSSGAGNGLLGLGWTLQGPSAITRCPKVRAIDGEHGTVSFTGNDRFCLDGQRLVLVDKNDPNAASPLNLPPYGSAGSEYRAVVDGFSRITAVGAHSSQPNVPLGFKVETKSGLILEFGNVLGSAGHSSQVLTNPSTSVGAVTPTINRWMLRRISDRHGSFVEFEYCKGEVTPAVSAPATAAGTATQSSCTAGSPWLGSTPIHYVRYTNRDAVVNGKFAVVFRYEARPDTPLSFHAGSASRQTQRLSAIQTFVDFASPASPGTLVRSYDIYYQPLTVGSVSQRATQTSRIAGIEERGFLNGQQLTLPRVAFTYADDAVFASYVKHTPSASTGTPPPEQCGGVIANRPGHPCR